MSGWGDVSRPLTMADLTDGLRVRDTAWGDVAGTIRKEGGRTLIRWDATGGSLEVSDLGPVFPSDLVILAEGEGAP